MRVDLPVEVGIDVRPFETGAARAADAAPLRPARIRHRVDRPAVARGVGAVKLELRRDDGSGHGGEVELEVGDIGRRQVHVDVVGRAVIRRRLGARLDVGVRDGSEAQDLRRIAAAAVRKAEAGAAGVVVAVARLGGLVEAVVAADRRAGAVRGARPRTRHVVEAVALLAGLVDQVVAAAGRRRGALDERDGVTDGAVLAHHLLDQPAAVDRHPGEVEGRLGVGGEAARADGAELVAAAARGDVHRAGARLDRDVVPQRLGALVVVIVAHEHHVDAVLVEERDEVRPHGEVAAVAAARIDGVVEGDELPGGRAGAQVVVEERVLGAARAGAGIRVQHHDVRVAEVEGIVVLGPGRVVGRRVEGAPPGGAPVGADVMVVDGGPDDEPAEQRAVWREEIGVVVGAEAAADHAARVQDEVDGRRIHGVTQGQPGQATAAARLSHHEEGEGQGRVVGLEDLLARERHAVGLRGIGVSRARHQAVGADRADGPRASRDDRRLPALRPDVEGAGRGRVRVPDDGDAVRALELQIWSAGQRHRAGRGRHQQRRGDEAAEASAGDPALMSERHLAHLLRAASAAAATATPVPPPHRRPRERFTLGHRARLGDATQQAGWFQPRRGGVGDRLGKRLGGFPKLR